MKEECGEVENDSEKAEEEKSGDTKKKWINNLKDEDNCEFCGIHNLIPPDTLLVEGEEQLYLLEKANTKATPDTQMEVKGDDLKIIFCIDVSGSMCATQEVQRQGKTHHISRIDAVKNSILAQIDEMKDSNPNRKVGIVLFNNSVTLLGDGSQSPIVSSL